MLNEPINTQTNKQKNRPRCYVKSPTVQDTFRPVPGLISSAGMIERLGLLSHAQNDLMPIVMQSLTSKVSLVCSIDFEILQWQAKPLTCQCHTFSAGFLKNSICSLTCYYELLFRGTNISYPIASPIHWSFHRIVVFQITRYLWVICWNLCSMIHL